MHLKGGLSFNVFMSAWPMIFLLLLGFCIAEPDHWRNQTTLGLMGGLFIIALFIKRRVHWSAALTFFCCALPAAFFTFSPFSPFSAWDDCGQSHFYASSAHSLIFLISIVIATISIREIDLETWLQAFAFLAFVDSTVMLYGYFSHNLANGLLSNPALDSTFVAVLMPTIISRTDTYPKDIEFNLIRASLILVPLIAILVSGSSTGFGVIAFEALLFAMLWTAVESNIAAWALSLAGLPSIYFAGQFLLGRELLNSNGRFLIWKMAIAHWLSEKPYLFGFGAGSYRWLGPDVQKLNGVHDGFMWAHNEILQVTYEQGFVGGISLLVLYYFMIIGASRARGNSLLITVAGVGFATLTQFPLRVWPFALFFSLICRITLLEFEHESN